jgi:hypothetical protein
MADGVQDLAIIDSYHPLAYRGTWHLSRQIEGRSADQHWYELDTFMTTQDHVRRFEKLRVASTFSDHKIKTISIQLRDGRGTTQSGKRAEKAIKKRLPPVTSRQKPLNVSMLRGPAETNEEVRNDYHNEMENLATDENLPQEWTWEFLADQCKEEIEKLVGRGRLAKGTPYMDGHYKQVVEGREQMRALASKYDNNAITRAEYLQAKKTFRAKRRRWRAQWLDEVLKDIERSMGCGDLGRFYKGLRELGLHLQENSARAIEMHTPAQLKDHFMKIGDAESIVSDAVLERLPPDREVDEDMAREPNDEEIHEVMAKMKESSAGPDEVTINMLRLTGPEFRRKLGQLIRRMWAEPEGWETLAHSGEVIALFKNKGTRESLDNYRGISLLSIISRVMARIIACRLTAHSEKHAIFRPDQWGFRPHRSTRDAILVARLLIEVATKVKSCTDDFDPVVLMLLDIKKPTHRSHETRAGE